MWYLSRVWWGQIVDVNGGIVQGQTGWTPVIGAIWLLMDKGFEFYREQGRAADDSFNVSDNYFVNYVVTMIRRTKCISKQQPGIFYL